MKLARPISRLFTTFSTTPKPERVTKNPITNDSIKELHAHLIRTHQHTDPFSMFDIIKSYALSSPPSLTKARFAFHQIDHPTLHLHNLMIRAFAQSDKHIEAIQLYDKIRERGFYINNLTLIYTFKACAKVLNILHGQRVHVNVIKLGYESYLYVCNAMIYMYASCGELSFSRRVFDEMSERDLVSWNSLICGYSNCDRYKEVLGVFESMRAANVKADAVTMVKVVIACSNLSDRILANDMVKYIEDNCVGIDVYLGNTLIDMYGRRGDVELAKQVFDRMVERNVVSWNAMIMGYAKAGELVAARKLFDEMPKRDVVSWTSMITGYCQADRFSDAIRLFQEMMKGKVKPDEVTVASVLSACAHIGSIDVGKAVHDYVYEHDVKMDIYVGNALIDMYCKCGAVKKGLEVFHDMKEKDSVSWTSVISGLAVNGIADHSIELFTEMLREGVRPTQGTFVGVLLACAHAGLVDKGLEYFEMMEKDYRLMPDMKHYGCVVDLLSRSGSLDRAYEFTKRMPVVPDVAVWRMLLSASKLHGNLVIAQIAANKLLELDPSNGGNYVLSSSTYAQAERWDDAMKMRELMHESDVQRPLGWSSIELEVTSSSKSQQQYVSQLQK